MEKKPVPEKPTHNKKTIALTAAAGILLGITGFEAVRENSTPQAPIVSPFASPALESQNEQLQMELNHATYNLNELKRQLFVKKSAPESQRVQKLQFEIAQNENTIQELNRLKNEKELLNDAFNDSNDHRAKLVDDLAIERTVASLSLSNHNSKFEKNIHSLEDTIYNLEIDLEIAQANKNEIETQYADLQKYAQESSLEAANNLKLEFEKSLEIQELLKNQLQIQTTLLQKKEEEWKEISHQHQFEIIGIQNEVELLKKILAEEQESNHAAKQGLTQLKEAHDHAAFRAQELQALIEEKEAFIAQNRLESEQNTLYLHQECKAIHDSLEEEKARCKELNERLSSSHQASEIEEELSRKLDLLANELTAEQQEKQNLETQILSHKEELFQAEGAHSELKLKLEEALQDAQSLNVRIITLEESLKNKEATHLETLEAELNLREGIKKEIEVLHSAKQLQEEYTRDLENSLRESANCLNESAIAIEVLHADKKDETADLNQLINQKIAHSNALQEELEFISQKYEETLNTLEHLEQELKASHSSNSENLAREQQEKQALQDEHAQLKQKLDSKTEEEENHKASQLELNQRYQDTLFVIEQLEHELNTSNSSNVEYELSTKLTLLAEKLAHVEQDKQALQEEHAELRQKLDSKTDEEENHKASQLELNQKYQDTLIAIEQLEHELNASNSSNAEKLAREQQERQALLDEHAELKQKLDSKSQEEENHKASQLELNQKYQDTLIAIEQLEHELNTSNSSNVEHELSTKLTLLAEKLAREQEEKQALLDEHAELRQKLDGKTEEEENHRISQHELNQKYQDTLIAIEQLEHELNASNASNAEKLAREQEERQALLDEHAELKQKLDGKTEEEENHRVSQLELNQKYQDTLIAIEQLEHELNASNASNAEKLAREQQEKQVLLDEHAELKQKLESKTDEMKKEAEWNEQKNYPEELND